MRYILIISLVCVALGCGEYNKVLKSTDNEYKFEKALEYYEEGDCYRALPIFEELIALWRGTGKIEKVQYYYARTHFCLGDYYLANYYFKNFAKTYAQSEYTEDALFMAAMCSYKLSPKPSLDQQDTRTAIDELQIFMNRYPASDRIDSCNVLMQTLKKKLETKAFEIAKLYYKTENFKSAVIAFDQMLLDYPGSVYAEEVMFLLVKTNYLYAERSIEEKKLERYEASTESYYNFVSRFPQSDYRREAENYFERSLKEMDRLNVANE